jgi:hypothetical protein
MISSAYSYSSSAVMDAMVARVAPMALELLGDGVPSLRAPTPLKSSASL